MTKHTALVAVSTITTLPYPIKVDQWEDCEYLSCSDDFWEEDQSATSGYRLIRTESLQRLDQRYPGLVAYLEGSSEEYPEVVINTKEDLRLLKVYYHDIETNLLNCDYVFINSSLDNEGRLRCTGNVPCHAWVEATDSELRLVTDVTLTSDDLKDLTDELIGGPDLGIDCPRCLGNDPCCSLCGGSGFVSSDFFEEDNDDV